MRPPLAALLLAGLLVAGGCLGFVGESRPPSDRRALDAVDRTRAALADVDSYRVRTDGSAERTADGTRDAITLTGEVTVDASAREMNGTGRVGDTFLPGTGVRRTYVAGHAAYTECRLTGWGRRELPESRQRIEYTPAGEQLALLNRTSVYWRGTERLDGAETAVVVAHPTERELAAAPRLWALGPRTFGDASLRNATLTLWVHTGTWLPVQVRRETAWRSGGADVTLAATWRFDGYDAPAVVTRPSFDESDVGEHGC